MAAYLLNWNPARWSWDFFDDTLHSVRSGESYIERWSTGNNQSIPVNSRVFLLRVGESRGIIGAGFTVSEVKTGPHWEVAGKTANYINFEYEVLLPIDQRLPTEVLIDKLPDFNWNRLQASGIGLTPTVEDAVERLWEEHLASLGFGRSVEASEVRGEAGLIEGAFRQVLVNAYERNATARRSCLEHYGFLCTACDFNFEQFYGQIGRDYIHVHHLKDLASIGEEYVVDPIADLRPVCPNCHAMLHTESPAMAISKLKSIIERQRKRAKG